IVLAGPTNITIFAELTCVAVTPSLTGQVVAVDCSPFTVTQDPAAGALIGLGTNVVNITVTDSNGLSTVSSALVAVVLPASQNTNMSITEFMAKNNTSITDENGTHSDWIEIHNSGTCPLNLFNWSLT